MSLATPEEKEKLLKTLQFEIQSLLSTEKEAIPSYQLLRNYRNEVGLDPPFVKLGYRSLDLLLLSMPNYVSCRTGPDGNLYVKAVPTEETRHINELVSGQRKKKTRGKRPSCYAGRYSVRPLAGSYRYPSTPLAPRFQPSWKPAPVRTAPSTNFQASGTESNYSKAPMNTSWQYRDSQVRRSPNYTAKKYPVCFSAWKAPTPEPPKEPEVPSVVTVPPSPAAQPLKQNYYQNVPSVTMNGLLKDPERQIASSTAANTQPTPMSYYNHNGWSKDSAPLNTYPPTSGAVHGSSSTAANTRPPSNFFNQNSWPKDSAPQNAQPTSSGPVFGPPSAAVKPSTSQYYQDVTSVPMKDWTQESAPRNGYPPSSGAVLGSSSAAANTRPQISLFNQNGWSKDSAPQNVQSTSSGAVFGAAKPSTSHYYQDVSSVPMKELLKEPAPQNPLPPSSSGAATKPVIPYYYQNEPTVVIKSMPMDPAPQTAAAKPAYNYLGCRPKEYSSTPFEPSKLVASQAPERSVDPSSLKITIQPIANLIQHATSSQPESYNEKSLKDKLSQWDKEDLLGPIQPGVFRAESLEESFNLAQEAAPIHQEEKPVETKFIRTINNILPAAYHRPSLAELEAAQITNSMKNLSLKSITRTVTQEPMKKEMLTPPSSPEPVAAPKMPALVPQQPTAKRVPTVSYLELLRRMVESKRLGHIFESTYETFSGRFIGRIEVNHQKFVTFPSEFDTAADALEEAARDAFVSLQMPSAY